MSELLLFRDAIDNLVDYTQGAPTDVDQRLFKRIIRRGFLAFVEAHPWGYYEQECTLLLPESTTLGSVRYVHSSRTVYTEWPISDITNATPAVATIDAGFLGTDGETVSIIGANNVPDGDYELNEVGTNQFELVGSAATGAYTGGATAYRFTWDTDIVGKRIKFGGNESYPVVYRTNDRAIELSSTANYGEDANPIDASVLVSRVLLPADFHKMDMVTDTSGLGWSDCFVQPREWLAHVQTSQGFSAYPFRWTILPSLAEPGRFTICWCGDPGDDRRISFIYTRRPGGTERWFGVESATSSAFNSASVAVSIGGDTVTGTNTNFDSTMVGAYIRVTATKSTAYDEPTGFDGVNPYRTQKKILAVNSATSLTVDSAFDFNATTGGFLISNLLDVSPHCINAFYASCEKEYAFVTNDADRLNVATAKYYEAMRQAMESDYQYSFNREASGYRVLPSAYGDPRNSDLGTIVQTPYF